MKRLRLSASARQDLDDIWNYVAEQSANPDIAEKALDEIGRRLVLLRRSPLAGRSRAELQAGLRSFPVGDYLIYYRIIQGQVIISRVIHGSRNQEEAFRGDRED